MPVTFEAYSDLVSGIYEAALDEERWREALEALTAAFGGMVGGLVLARPDDSEGAISTATFDPASIESYNSYYGRLDHVARAVRQVPAGHSLGGDRIITREALLRSEFYADWARPLGLGDGLFTRLSQGPAGEAAWLAVAAPLGAESFATPERLRLARLVTPHLQRAVEVQNRLRMGAGRAWEAALADSTRLPLAVLAEAGRLLHCNAAFDALFAAGRLALVHGRLTAGPAGGESALRQALATVGGMAGAPAGATLLLPRTERAAALVVHALPVGSPAVRAAWPEARALLIVIDPQRPPDAPEALLRDLFGLTRAEIATARCVLSGDSGLRQAAEALGISVATAKTHLQRTFDKTGVRRQVDLVRLFLALDAGRAP